MKTWNMACKLHPPEKEQQFKYRDPVLIKEMGKIKDSETQTQKLCLLRDVENLQKTEKTQLLMAVMDGEVARKNGTH